MHFRVRGEIVLKKRGGADSLVLDVSRVVQTGAAERAPAAVARDLIAEHHPAFDQAVWNGEPDVVEDPAAEMAAAGAPSLFD